MPSTAGVSARAGWFVGPAMILGAAAAVALVVRGLDRAFAVALGLLVALSVGWILVSVFWPAKADRRCPECGQEALRRLDPGTTRGVLCSSCGAEDAERSSFLLAEEEDAPIETSVLRERRRESALRP